MTKTSSSRHFDFIVIGAGLSGLAIAKRLSLENAKVLLVEGQDRVGGTNHPAMFGTQTAAAASINPTSEPASLMMNNGLRLLPDSADTRNALEFLSTLLHTNLSLSQVESSPLTYESGGLRPFVGFGDAAPPFLHQIAGFLNSSRIETQPQPWAWCQALNENAGYELMTKSFVTRFNITDDKIASVTLNGQKEYTADQYIFTGSATLVKALLPNELWTPKAKSKFSKLKLWTQVGLDFVHATPVYEGSNILLLDGTTQDDLGPCLGTFQNHVIAPTEGQSEPTTITTSQWMTFLEDDEAEDSEILGQSLKKIRRQIKRAFPAAFEDLIFERICISPSTSATLPTGSFLPEFENLHYGNGQLSVHQGVVGDLLQAQSVLRSLGFAANAPIAEPSQASEASEMTDENFEASL